MKPEFLKEVLEKIRAVKIAVVGDYCLDAYWFVDESKSEISVETGKPTEPVRRQKYSLGGAGNVANNLASLGIKEIKAFGVTGNDPFGAEMIAIMNQTGINTKNMLIQDTDWATHVYIKPYTGEIEKSRIDFGNFNYLADKTAEILIQNLQIEIIETDLVIINQQVLSGIHTEYFRQKLVEVISQFPEKIFIADSRNYTDFYRGAYRKMNDTEAARLCEIKKEQGETVSYQEVIYAAEQLYERYRKPLFITRGGRGSVVTDDKGISEIGGMMIISRIDTVGAGDSYLAGASAALAAGYSLETAGEIGTFTAGVTVQKLFQTGTASPEEVYKIGGDADYIYHPELAEDIRHADYLQKSEIEIITKWPADFRIIYAIFDNDGTISTLREGWEQIMAPMMIRAVLGEKYKEADETLYLRVKSAVLDLIDKTTGIQTLKQMNILLGLIKEFGFVPEEGMLDERGYKEIYNNDLMEMVSKREEKLKNGEITIEDLTIKGSIPFLKMLHDKGIRLYLTSGTDEADVKHEAGVLGYDSLFEGRIFGATGDLNADSKKMVLDSILDSIGDNEAASIVTFGDGPVEIRETRKRGGKTAGVASNELRRYGLNQAKRTRLIKAGADIIVPDLSQFEKLLGLLNIR
ncbi:MAG TPA: carbohydrate kinase [Bacteroidales bacterium]|nr:carbohydrate kinase [Bacteroidales bacterium]HBZ22053.1 carbohydrate kinase [Bacteroidales bacterium]